MQQALSGCLPTMLSSCCAAPCGSLTLAGASRLHCLANRVLAAAQQGATFLTLQAYLECRSSGSCLMRATVMLLHAEQPKSAPLQNCMTADVFGQLNKISAQQSKIRSMRNKLVAFREVANKQQEAFAELQLLRRVPTAYRHCLAECVRRSGWSPGLFHAGAFEFYTGMRCLLPLPGQTV